MSGANAPGRALVTGGGGYIGSHVVSMLQQAGHEVCVLERPGAPTDHLQDVDIIEADIRETDRMDDTIQGFDLVIHLAANPNLWARDPGEFEAVNHQGTRHVLQAAIDSGTRRIIFVSTESILSPRRGATVISEDVHTTLEDMVGPYCRSKWLAEQVAMEAAAQGHPVVIVRPSVPVGPGDRHGGPLTRMMADFQAGRIKGWMRGELNLIDVRDVAAGILAAATVGEYGRPYLLVNENWTIRAFLQLLAEYTNRRAPRFKVPYGMALAFAHVEEALCRRRSDGRVPMATVTGVRLTRRCFRFDGQRSARDLGLKPMRCCRAAIAASLLT